MAMGAERSKLHNFNFPQCLKWGNPRLLRCMKEKPKGDYPSAAAPDRRSSGLETEKGASGNREWRGSIVKSPPAAGGSGLSRAALVDGHKQDQIQGIEAFGAKLVSDLQVEPVKLKVVSPNPNEGQKPSGPAPPPRPTEADSPRPWNLRTRRAACKAPMVGNGGGKSLRIDGKKSGTEENRGKTKMCVHLSKREIEEDFHAVVGHPPPRRPKKRPRNVQTELDTLFPGLWLSKIKPSMYKVPHFPDYSKGL